MPSIKDVAQRAGVSIATVSRVLSDKPNVRPEVRARVHAVVQELGYRPNRVASSLRKRTANVIGLLVSDIRNPFFTAIARAIEDAFNEADMGVFLCNTDEDPEKESRYLHMLLDENVAGIIISPTPGGEQRGFDAVLGAQTPLVCIDRRLETATVDSVTSDNINSARLLTDHLIERGYRRVGAVIGLQASMTGRERMQGYLESMNAHGLTPRAAFVHPREDASSALVGCWLGEDDAPDAILAGNSRLTIGALSAIRAAGLTTPQIGLAGFDETVWMPYVSGGVTVISQPTHDIGRAAAELLLERIDTPNRPTREIVFRGQLIIRASTRG